MKTKEPKRFLVLVSMVTLLAGVFTAAPVAAAVDPHVMVWWTGGNNIIGQGWTHGSTVTLTADDPSTAVEPDWTEAVIAEKTKFDFKVSPAIDLRPGFVVTATDGAVTKSLTIQGVIVTEIDTEADTVSGLGPPFALIASQIWSPSLDITGRNATADSTGRWTADFSIPGLQPGAGEGPAVDIRSGFNVNALTKDADGDFTFWQAKDRDSLTIIQALPDTQADVCLDGTKALLGLGSGEVFTSIPFDARPSNHIDLAVLPAGSSCEAEPIAEALDVELTVRGSVTAVAHLTEGGVPALDVFTNNVRPTKPHAARLTIRHVADAPSFDVWTDGLIFDRQSSGDSHSIAVRDGVHALWWSELGDYLPVIGPEVMKLTQGRAYQIHLWEDPEVGFTMIILSSRVGMT